MDCMHYADMNLKLVQTLYTCIVVNDVIAVNDLR